MGDRALLEIEEPFGILRDVKLIVWGEARATGAGLALATAARTSATNAEANIVRETKIETALGESEGNEKKFLDIPW